MDASMSEASCRRKAALRRLSGHLRSPIAVPCIVGRAHPLPFEKRVEARFRGQRGAYKILRGKVGSFNRPPGSHETFDRFPDEIDAERTIADQQENQRAQDPICNE